MCQREGRIEHAVDVNHKKRVRDGGTNDWSNLEGLCRHHHRSVVQSRERRGAVPHGCNEDGTPKDPDHPWNREPDNAA
nr:HNH endonuclease signature motif containing protein [Rhodospira trueperi]